MTSLRKRKTRLVLETDATVRYRGKMRPVIIEVGPYFCTARLKGTQARYEMSWMSIFTRAAEITADREREERKTRRKRGAQ